MARDLGPDGIDDVRAAVADARESLVFSVEETAMRLGISRAFAYKLASTGELPVLRLGGRMLVPRAALEQLVANAGR